ITNRNIEDWVAELTALASAAWNAEVFVFDDQAITLGKMVVGILLLFTGIWIAKLFTRFIGRWMLSRLGLNEGISAAVQTVVFYILLITVVLFALKLINVPLTVFTVIGGALALGIGIGSQNLMSNFMSGLILLAERPIRVGDFVQINNLSGIVSHIGARSTNITTPENIDIIVPNSSFLEDHVTNWTLNDNKIRTSILVGVTYGSNVREVTKLLKRAADTHGKVLKQPSPIVLFKNFGNDALEFELLIWVNMKRLIERLMIESDLRYQIEHLFREAGIVIAFPQRDVHLDTMRPLELKMIQELPNREANPQEIKKEEPGGLDEEHPEKRE
ncbi:MAG: mechanosensitive ion channel, partial [Pseudomonadales bacterium]|nr:mechanosensitive ion channel [Pseudomonadales bacterium]